MMEPLYMIGITFQIQQQIYSKQQLIILLGVHYVAWFTKSIDSNFVGQRWHEIVLARGILQGFKILKNFKILCLYHTKYR